ncbi:hypothetical protein [Streptomyces erythrochromogenes]|uniref:hypothetical protein n=1 Tax=Streptomyces erythrochromogenes TaxID=285574 RepID=UPI00386B29EB|nr:hypothetical protein OG364_08710 [Streptomyces erythrochromogenes]
MTTRTKAAAPRAATARRRPGPGPGRPHGTALPAPFRALLPAGPGAARGLPAGPEDTRTGACAAPRVTAGPSGAPGTPPSAHPACAGDLRRTSPAYRSGRAPGRATTPTATASFPSDHGRTAGESTRGSGLPARNPQTGPEGERTTGEGA